MNGNYRIPVPFFEKDPDFSLLTVDVTALYRFDQMYLAAAGIEQDLLFGLCDKLKAAVPEN